MAAAQTIPVTKAGLFDTVSREPDVLAMESLLEMITDQLEIHPGDGVEELSGDGTEFKYTFVHPDFAGLPEKSISFSPDRQTVTISVGLAVAGSDLFTLIKNFVNPVGAGAAGAPMGGGRRRYRKTQKKNRHHRKAKKSQRKTKSRRQRRQ